MALPSATWPRLLTQLTRVPFVLGGVPVMLEIVHVMWDLQALLVREQNVKVTAATGEGAHPWLIL